MVDKTNEGITRYTYTGIMQYMLTFEIHFETDVVITLETATERQTLVLHDDYEVVERNGHVYVALDEDLEPDFEPTVLQAARNIPYTQELEIPSGEPINRSLLERALDRIIWMIQTAARSVEGIIRFPLGESVDPTLPSNIQRRDRYLGFGPLGAFIAWKNGYDPDVFEGIHIEGSQSQDADMHNYFYDMYDNASTSAHLEGFLKGWVMAGLIEDPAGPTDQLIAYIESGDPDIDYACFRYDTGEIEFHKDGTHLEVKEIPVDPGMIFMFPGDGVKPPDGELLTQYLGMFPLPIEAQPGGDVTGGTETHTHPEGTATSGDDFLNSQNPGGGPNLYDHFPMDDNAHRHPMQHVHPPATTIPIHSSFLPYSGFNKIPAGACLLTDHSVESLSGFSEVTHIYGDGYIRFEDDNKVLAGSNTHIHDTVDGQLRNVYGGLNSTPPVTPTTFQALHGHSHPFVHSSGLSNHAPASTTYKMWRANIDLDRFPARCFTFYRPGVTIPPSLSILNTALFPRISSVAETIPIGTHTHSDVGTSGGPTPGVPFDWQSGPGPLCAMNVEAHTHDGAHIHDASANIPPNIRMVLVEVNTEKIALPVQPYAGGAHHAESGQYFIHTGVAPGAVFIFDRYGIIATTIDTDSSHYVISTRKGFGYIWTDTNDGIWYENEWDAELKEWGEDIIIPCTAGEGHFFTTNIYTREVFGLNVVSGIIWRRDPETGEWAALPDPTPTADSYKDIKYAQFYNGYFITTMSNIGTELRIFYTPDFIDYTQVGQFVNISGDTHWITLLGNSGGLVVFRGSPTSGASFYVTHALTPVTKWESIIFPGVPTRDNPIWIDSCNYFIQSSPDHRISTKLQRDICMERTYDPNYVPPLP